MVTQFRKAAALDAPADPEEYLARALVRASESERNPRIRASLLNEAEQHYLKIALQPAYVWYSTSRHLYPPGYWADGMTAWLGIAMQRKHLDEPHAQILKELETLRPTEFAHVSRSKGAPNQSILRKQLNAVH